MSEAANPVTVPVAEEKASLKPQQDKPTTNDVVVNEAKSEVTNDLKKEASTPATGRGQRRKRTSELADASLVIETPDSGNRRTTRSQTRGTPAPAPTPAKKPALEKPSNGSAAKGRRGRPPKSANEDKPAEAAISEESVKEDEEPEAEEAKSEKESKTKEPEAKAEASKVEEKKVEKKEAAEAVDGGSSSKEAKKEDKTPDVPAPAVKKVEEPKPEAKPVESNAENSQTKEAEQPKQEKPVVEKPTVVAESGDKAPEKPTEVVNNTTSETVNNHEQA